MTNTWKTPVIPPDRFTFQEAHGPVGVHVRQAVGFGYRLRLREGRVEHLEVVYSPLPWEETVRRK